MIGRICVTLVFVVWPLVGLACGLLEADWALFRGFATFLLVIVAIAVFTLWTMLIWKRR